MNNKRKYILSSSVLIIGLLITAAIVSGDVKDTCEDNKSDDTEHSYLLEANDEKNEQRDSSLAVTDKSPLNIPIILIIPCAIALVVILFFIFKILYRFIREKLE